VVSPLPEQQQLVAATWLRRLGRSVFVESADPYTEVASSEVAAACERLAGAGAELVFLDCIGYTKASAATAAARAGVPVLTGRGLAVREAVRQGQGRPQHGSMP
jgi:protein AroM